MEYYFISFEDMQVLWKANKPMKIREICDELKNTAWKYNTVGTLLLRMNDKGRYRRNTQYYLFQLSCL